MIEIVTHAYAGDLPQYAVFLRAQLSSLVLYPPSVPVRVAVCCDSDDTPIADVVDDDWGTLAVIPCDLPRTDLFRRAIGRNLVALGIANAPQADLVWFCDVDHLFGPGCLDGLWAAWQRLPNHKPAMVYPATVLTHIEHSIGDDFVRQHKDAQGLIRADHAGFAPRAYRRAIGGVQIVGGDFARRYGYLNGHRKWQTPTDGTRPFPDFRDDVAYRKFCAAHGGIQRIDIPQLYRMRHTAVTYK